MLNGTYGGVRGEKHIKCYPLLDLKNVSKNKKAPIWELKLIWSDFETGMRKNAYFVSSSLI